MSAAHQSIMILLKNEIELESIENELSALQIEALHVEFLDKAEVVSNKPQFKDWDHFRNNLKIKFNDGQILECEIYYNPPRNGKVQCFEIVAKDSWKNSILFIEKQSLIVQALSEILSNIDFIFHSQGSMICEELLKDYLGLKELQSNDYLNRNLLSKIEI